jgi:hypothetical protein
MDNLGLEVSDTPWINDEGLRQFFKDEASQTNPYKKLSTSVGNGFY